MIHTTAMTKKFGSFVALDDITCHIPAGSIYGLVGSNGAGKSTFLRLLTGIYKPEQGSITLAGQPVYGNPSAKSQMVLVPDELYCLPGANLHRMAKFYQRLYPTFQPQRFVSLVEGLQLPQKRALSEFSKGMKRQAALALALSVEAKVYLFDETFDGLDPLMRKVMKSYLCNLVAQQGATVVVTSHSMRELEDMCDRLALLHQGKLILENQVDWLKSQVFKVQVAFDFEYDQSLFEEFTPISFEKKGSVAHVILQGSREEIQRLLLSKSPLLCEVVPLTLEELFLYQVTQQGYDFTALWEGVCHDQE